MTRRRDLDGCDYVTWCKYSHENHYAPPLERELPALPLLCVESWTRHVQSRGVYFLADERGVCVYIGMTTDVQQRFGYHVTTKSFHSAFFMPLRCSHQRMRNIESALILLYRPKFNYGVMRDGRRYLYGAAAHDDRSAMRAALRIESGSFPREHLTGQGAKR